MNKKFLLAMPALFILAMLSGIFLPIYSDEVVTKFSAARFFLENGKLLSFFPQCTNSVGYDVSWVFYPAAILISSIYAYLGPLGMRASGIILAIAWFVLLGYWCYRQSKDSWTEKFALLVAVASLGVMPYLWVISRPEQFMLIPFLIFSIAALPSSKSPSTSQQTITFMLFSLTASVFFYAHPKSIFFAPYLFITGWIFTRKFKLIFRVLLPVYILLLSVQTLRDASLLSGCQDAPAVRALLEINSLMPGMLLDNPIGFIATALHNVFSFPDRMLGHLIYNPTFQSGWLPPLTHSPALLPVLNTLIYWTIFALVVVSHFMAIGLAAAHLIRRQMPSMLLLAAALASCDLINITLYKVQNFYAGIQYIPISIIIFMLISQHRTSTPPWKYKDIAHRIFGVFAITLSLISMATLLYLVTPNMIRNSEFKSATIPNQPLSIPVFGVAKHLSSIRALGASCQIPENNAQYLVVDHMSYFAYTKAQSPMHVLYVSEFGYGGDLANGKLLPFLRGKHSSGLITRCEWVPLAFRDTQQKNDLGYCCVNLDKQ